ncbi:class I SAM-dependent methyltransferase [Sulfurimonas sp. HSL1-2]|uniref:class I SAM-dependent methyltransferase n=1 Tax=Thiomicrolovo zhangzhouensis TaxID=3131933 RepID=UPI0031F78C6A
MSRFDAAAADWDKGDLRQQIAAHTADAVINTIALNSEMSLLDFGAGTGLLTYRVAPHVGSVTAVDTSEKMLEVLQSKSTPEHQIKTACCDITQMPLSETFDGIISSMAMHHVEDTEGFLKTLYEHLNPGGFIAVADLDKEDGSFHSHGNDGVFHFGFDRETLKGMAEKCGFVNAAFTTALTIEKPDRNYPVFLFSAYKA